MDREFWYHRWRSNQTGFHEPDVNALLVRHWNRLSADRSARVLVPLCGKALDMVWLAQQGHRVVGVELSPVAVEAFFEEQGLDPRVRNRGGVEIWDAGDIRIICGDFFDVDVGLVGRVGAVYDRAALIALPPPLRDRYVRHLVTLLPPAGAPMLLITLEYEQARMDGPPFSVREAEVRERYTDRWRVERVHEEDALASNPRFREKGLDSLCQAVYVLTPLTT